MPISMPAGKASATVLVAPKDCRGIVGGRRRDFRREGNYDAQFNERLGLAGQDPALGRRRDDSSFARSWLVDDAYDPPAGAARELCRAFGHGIRSLRAAASAAAVAMVQPGAGASRRSATLGAHRRAPRACRPFRPDVA